MSSFPSRCEHGGLLLTGRRKRAPTNLSCSQIHQGELFQSCRKSKNIRHEESEKHPQLYVRDISGPLYGTKREQGQRT